MYRYVIIFLFVTSLIACESDYSYRGDSNSIAFSTDTLSFDTIFSGNVSVTKQMLIYNTSGTDMTIDHIYLGSGTESDYNISINGSASTEVTNVRLRSGDSLYVFVNVYPKYNSDKPYCLTEDNIVVQAGSNIFSSHLWACGLTANRVSGQISSNTQWTSEVPYLISDTLIIAPNVTLSIAEGAYIYMNNDALIEIRGELIANGTLSAPINIRASRTGQFYSDIPGQWQGIVVSTPQGKANFAFTQIANATTALIVDSAAVATLTDIEIRDAKKCAIDGRCANIELKNSLLYNCGSSLLKIVDGNTIINHCTMVNYYRWNVRNEASVVADATEQSKYTFQMTNSVVAGNLTKELNLNDNMSSEHCNINNCYIRLGSKNSDQTDKRLENVTDGKEPKFVSVDEHNYHLTKESPLIDAGAAEYSKQLIVDHDGIIRTEKGNPDIGAYEYVE